MVPPRLMCRQHLLGEHVELHMLVGTIKANKSVDGYVNKNLIMTSKIKERHDALVNEMGNRGYNHKSPLEYDDKLHKGQVSVLDSIAELVKRCPECKKRIEDER